MRIGLKDIGQALWESRPPFWVVLLSCALLSYLATILVCSRTP